MLADYRKSTQPVKSRQRTHIMSDKASLDIPVSSQRQKLAIPVWSANGHMVRELSEDATVFEDLQQVFSVRGMQVESAIRFQRSGDRPIDP
jgi:hypothetical protein